MLQNAFDMLLNFHSRSMTIERLGQDLSDSIAPQDIKVSPSNFSRNLSAPEETTVAGREFVITKSALDLADFPTPKKGDRLEDCELGEFIISEVREMYDFGGVIIGYRCRTS